MRRVALLTALAAGVVFAAAPPTETGPSDELRFVYLTDKGPVRIAMHLRYGDRPYQAAFQDWAKKFFAHFDTDKSGALSPAEAGRLLDPNFLSTIAQGGITGGRFNAVQFATLDTDKDGKVSDREFINYLGRASLGGFRFSMDESAAQSATRVNDALWRLLDANRDGKLSKDEVARMPGLMTKLDENENEYLTEDELVPNLTNPFGGFVERPIGMMAGGPTSSLLSREQPGAAAGPALLRTYDRNKDGKLSREEISLDEKSFKQLDTDGKGYLDAKKLSKVFDLSPEVTFRGVIGPLPRVPGLLDLVGLGGRFGPKRLTLLTPSAPRGGSVKVTSQDTAEAKFGVSWLAVNTSSQGSGTFRRFNRIKNFYEQQFDSSAGEKKEPLTKEQAESNQFLGSLFAASDANGDGKLERKELSAFLDLIESAQQTVTTAQCRDQGQSLFKVVSSAGGGAQLSLRDLRMAWKRIEPLCKDGKHLTREDLPHRVSMTLSDGPDFGGRAVFVGDFGGAPVMRGGGPAWFSKMDLNGDGDVSPKEWLGTEEDFRRLDADKDGLISAEEGRKAGEKK
jgi:Ca2+-binding EF-hand superfamily protein